MHTEKLEEKERKKIFYAAANIHPKSSLFCAQFFFPFSLVSFFSSVFLSIRYRSIYMYVCMFIRFSFISFSGFYEMEILLEFFFWSTLSMY